MFGSFNVTEDAAGNHGEGRLVRGSEDVGEGVGVGLSKRDSD